MTLPKKTLLAIGIVFTGLIGGLYMASSTILLNSLRQTESQHTRQTVAGVLSAFTQTQDDFNSSFSDWSAWDDTYKFVKDANKDYIKSNLTKKALAIIKVHLALVIQPSNRIVFGTGLDQTYQKQIAIPATLRAHLSPQDRLLRYPNTESSWAGIMLLPEGPMLISSRPILTTEAKGPIRGTVMFGRFLNADEIAKLSKVSRLHITMHGLNEIKLPPDFQVVRKELSASNPILIRPLSDRTISGYALVNDIYGKPALLLRVDAPRDIYRQGNTSLHYLIASILVLGLLFGGLILLLLRRLVLSQYQQQQSERRYRTVVTQAAEGIFLIDADTKQIIETNTAGENLLGYTAADLCLLTLYDVVADDCESINRSLELILMEHHFSSEKKYRRQDGQLVDVEVNANLISHDGRNVFCIIVHDITQRKQIEEQLLHDAFHDSLTGLANRALFMERLTHAIQLTKRRDDYTFAVLFLDLDRFKVINDSLGHMVGDQLLIAIAQRLQICLPKRDTFARLGGDEFAIFIEDSSNVAQIVEQIQQELKLPFNLDGQEMYATASIGVILNTTGYDQPEALLRDADIAMYRAKLGGKARYEVFDVCMHDQAVALLHLENDLRQAIRTCEFQLCYQPIVSLRNNEITGFEALVRWQHPTRGLISPVDFIPIAEDTGLIVPLGWWVLQEACRQMRAWQVQFFAYSPLTISVNLSVKQFGQADLVEQIARILDETNLDPWSLKLEITESVLMEASESVAAAMQQLKALGVSLSLDDFGTGYSSLSYLHRFPIDTLKIDRSFVSSIGNGLESWEIVRAIAMMAHALGMDVIAEGVETKEQIAQLKALKCRYAQGYFFSEPVTSVTAGELIAKKLGGVQNQLVFATLKQA